MWGDCSNQRKTRGARCRNRGAGSGKRRKAESEGLGATEELGVGKSNRFPFILGDGSLFLSFVISLVRIHLPETGVREGKEELATSRRARTADRKRTVLP